MKMDQRTVGKLLIWLSVLVTAAGLALGPYPAARAALEAVALLVALLGVAGRGIPSVPFGAAAALLAWTIYVSLVDSGAGGSNEFLGGFAAPILGPVVGLLAWVARKIVARREDARQ